MSIDEALEFIENYQRWRLGEDGIEQPNPYEISIALTKIINYMKAEKTLSGFNWGTHCTKIEKVLNSCQQNSDDTKDK